MDRMNRTEAREALVILRELIFEDGDTDKENEIEIDRREALSVALKTFDEYEQLRKNEAELLALVKTKEDELNTLKGWHETCKKDLEKANGRLAIAEEKLDRIKKK